MVFLSIRASEHNFRSNSFRGLSDVEREPRLLVLELHALQFGDSAGKLLLGDDEVVLQANDEIVRVKDDCLLLAGSSYAEGDVQWEGLEWRVFGQFDLAALVAREGERMGLCRKDTARKTKQVNQSSVPV